MITIDPSEITNDSFICECGFEIEVDEEALDENGDVITCPQCEQEYYIDL